ncbi:MULTISPECIES: carbamate kinase [Thermoanaerobacter]|uniref:carbamate kinase n=1 Tax=Thermoanaerobacter TaxID=1754 RepID=UPI000573D323|nr:carbamate kinase [Thermoanaerobacter sp. YS13]KHO61050.1 carbamate kinase [Thermoanaerobacter sp. YS13]
MKEKVVIALGGNALQDVNTPPTAEAQMEVVKRTAGYLADIIEKGYSVVITHGNGPQVGNIVIQNEVASMIVPAMPFDVCGAESQGMIGYMVQQALREVLKERNIRKEVATIITQVVVDKNDPAFGKPTKPIGPFYTKEEAEVLIKEKGYEMVEDSGRGYRRVVPSPDPKEIVELNTIKLLEKNGVIVITVGGGGIPVIKENGNLKGVAAVIDKDLASEKLAEDIDADVLLILTAVEKVAINYNKPNQKFLDKMTVEEAIKYMEEGHFAPGSMFPKIKAAVRFAKSKVGRRAIITSLGKALEALEGKAGTVISL